MLQNYAIFIIFGLLILMVVLKEPSFLSFRVFSQIMSQASTRLIIALGVAGIIISGGTDLAAGRMIGMSAIITATLLQDPEYPKRIFANMPVLPVIIPILVAIVVSLIFSFIHGFTVAKLKVPSFVASLGIQLVVYGAMSLYYDHVNNGSPIGSLDIRFKNWAQGAISIGSFRLPLLIVYAAATAVVIWFIWNKTKLGKNMYAIGGNIEAATVCGVNVIRDTIFIYLLAGILYAIAGGLEGARTGSVTNSLGADYMLDAIAACVVGGVSMRGGIGKISGVVIGVLLFQVVNYGLVYISISPYLQYVVRGLIILIAVAIDTQRFVKKR